VKSAWHKALALTLSAVYVSVVVLGHCFHNHSLGHGGHCRCVATCCLEGCHGHDHDGDAACHYDGSATGLSSSLAGDWGVASHDCPVCQFFSHHSSPVVAAEVMVVGHVVERVLQTATLITIGADSGPYAPRAPPLFA